MVIEIAGQQWTVQKVESHNPGLFVDQIACRGACWSGRSEWFRKKYNCEAVMPVLRYKRWRNSDRRSEHPGISVG